MLPSVDEFYRVAFRKKIYRTIDELQSDLDGWVWVKEYNETRPPQGRWCYGKSQCKPSLTHCLHIPVMTTMRSGA